MELKTFGTFVKEVGDREVVALFSVMGRLDEINDRVWNGAFLKTIQERLDRVRVLWQHDMSAPPVGTVKELYEVARHDLPEQYLKRYPEATGGLCGKIEYLDTPRGNEVLVGTKAGAINENSIGFDIIKQDFTEEENENGRCMVRNIREVRLWDISPVNWGMNEAARVLAKSIVPYRDTGIISPDETWALPTLTVYTDADWRDLSESEKRRISEHYAWCEQFPAVSFSGCKLPHHKASATGIGPAVWSGVEAAMDALMGKSGRLEIPESDRKGIYAHLAKHYQEFGKEAPEFDFVELCYSTVLLSSASGIKVGRVISQANMEKLKTAVDQLNEIIHAAEPQEEPGEKSTLDQALTARNLALKTQRLLETRQRALRALEA